MPIILPSVSESLGSGSATQILQGTGTSSPSGIDAIASYNGLTMNNRNWLDTIIVTGIDGFSDADIRDDRENDPQAHGETAFESWYGGRTIVIKGYIRSFTLDKLRDLEVALKSAFMSLEEKPLKIQGRTLPATVQIFCKKNAPMQWSEEQTRDDYFKRDFMITLRASNPRFFSLEEEFNSEEFGVIDVFATDTVKAGNYKFLAGESQVKVESGVLKFTASGLKTFSTQQPESFQPQPSVQFDYTPKGSLSGSESAVYLKRIDANNYIRLSVSAAGAVTLVAKVEGVENTRVLNYSLGSSPISRSLGTTYRIKAELRGGFIWFYHGTTVSWVQIAKYELSFAESTAMGPEIFSRSYVDINPGTVAPTEWQLDNPAFGSSVMNDQQVMSVVNNGSFEAQPIFEITGPIEAPQIHVAETDKSLIFKSNSAIPAGDTWKIDIRKGTIIDSNGQSKFNWLDPTSDWPELIGGRSNLRLSGTNMSPVVSGIHGYIPGLSVRYHHAWF